MAVAVDPPSAWSPTIPLQGARPALVTAQGRLSHDQLAARIAAVASEWGPGRRLVLIELGNDLDSVVSYLAALNHGHVALVVPAERPDQRDSMIAAYDPDIVCRTGAPAQIIRERSAHVLHRELALLLSTSGSSGSPKLVRLSAANVASNARAIASYQRLTSQDRAITSLPLHYCFGLSVLHSHLIVGGSVVLTGLSVVDDCFWELARTTGVSTLSGVPYTFELLERAGEPQRSLPTLRRLAQAGGRLDPSQVKRLAQQSRADGCDFFVMYGQTEATARMAYLPPELAVTHPDCVGVPIPGGSFRLEPSPEATESGVGELVYEGPNVMMGYAQSSADLALGSGPSVLRTGDLARERDGLIQIVGRRSRIAKLFGLRIDLDHVERSLADRGIRARCIATDRAVHLFLPHGRQLEQARQLGAASCAVPVVAVQAHLLESTPQTASGKVDHAALLRWAQDAEADHERAQRRREQAEGEADLQARVMRAYQQVLGRIAVRPTDSFVDLGGDSLSYVELSTRLEQLLPGDLPAGWPRLRIEELASAQWSQIGAPTPAVTRWGQTARLDITLVLRAVAIVLIVASHADVIAVMGGAHLLLALAGFNFARFQLAAEHSRTRVRRTLVSMATIAIPSSIWIGAVALIDGRYHWPTALYLHQLTGATDWTPDREFWFLDALLLAMAGAAVLLAIDGVNRFERRHPWRFALLITGACAALRVLWVGQHAGQIERYLAPVVLMFFALGWLIARADTGWRRLVASAVAVGSVIGFFGDLQRELVVIGGLLLTLWLPTLRLPRMLVRPLGTIAAASLGIYLTHWLVYPSLEDAGLGVLAVGASIVAGIAYSAVSARVRAVALHAAHQLTQNSGSQTIGPRTRPDSILDRASEAQPTPPRA